MDRAVLVATLETANRHVADGAKHIERQREIVARLEQKGRGASHTAKLARDLLFSMERAQRAHLSHRDQLAAEFARLDGVEKPPLSLLINGSARAERGRDKHIEVQERS